MTIYNSNQELHCYREAPGILIVSVAPSGRPTGVAPMCWQDKWLKNNKETNAGTALPGYPKKSGKIMYHQYSVSRIDNNK